MRITIESLDDDPITIPTLRQLLAVVLESVRVRTGLTRRGARISDSRRVDDSPSQVRKCSGVNPWVAEHEHLGTRWAALTGRRCQCADGHCPASGCARRTRT
jgi:hypothetical protein